MTTISRVDTRNPLLVGVLRTAMVVTVLTGALVVGALLGLSTIAGTPDVPSAVSTASAQLSVQ